MPDNCPRGQSAIWSYSDTDFRSFCCKSLFFQERKKHAIEEMNAMEDEMKRAEDLIKARKDHQEKQAAASVRRYVTKSVLYDLLKVTMNISWYTYLSIYKKYTVDGNVILWRWKVLYLLRLLTMVWIIFSDIDIVFWVWYLFLAHLT